MLAVPCVIRVIVCPTFFSVWGDGLIVLFFMVYNVLVVVLEHTKGRAQEAVKRKKVYAFYLLYILTIENDGAIG